MRQLSSNEISAVSGGTFFNLKSPCAPIPYLIGFIGGVFKILVGKPSTTPPPSCNCGNGGGDAN